MKNSDFKDLLTSISQAREIHRRRKMEKKEVKSSTIKTVKYFPEIEMLEVEFKRGANYTYFDVPQNVYEELINAESVGSYFNKNIAKNFDYTREVL